MNITESERATLELIADSKHSLGICTLYKLKTNKMSVAVIETEDKSFKIDINSSDASFMDSNITIILTQDNTVIIDNHSNKLVVNLKGITDIKSDKGINSFEIGIYTLYELKCNKEEKEEPLNNMVIIFNNKDKTIERIIGNVERVCNYIDNHAKVFYYSDNMEEGIIEYFYTDASKNKIYTYSKDLTEFCELLYSN